MNIQDLGLLEDPTVTASKAPWEKIGVKRRAGVLIPLFSIYSDKSTGVGDLGDLRLCIDWIEAIGHSILQLLPLNEVGAFRCPYDPISSFALEPMYLSLDQRFLPGISDFASRLAELKKRFPTTTKYLDYSLKNEKIDLLGDYFLQNNPGGDPEFKSFKEANSYWLFDYALYKVIKSRQDELSWYEWEAAYRDRDKDVLSDFSREHKNRIEFHCWLQWQLYRQLKDIKAYAAKKNVLLKGDLPLLVSRDSADVWAQRDCFKLEFASGAPPDMFCAKGQRWGMPPYDWGKIASRDYRYLREKLKYAENFYDLARIDHVVGLFCIWTIPVSAPFEDRGIGGFYDPPDQLSRESQGREILKVLLESTDMLFCAEDLGITPKVCPRVISELGIPGNDVQRWVKDWAGGRNFLPAQEYRFLSVAMLSTPDTANWPGWWENEAQAEEKKELWGLFGLTGQIRQKSDQELVGAAVDFCYSSKAVFCINNIFDLFFLDGVIRDDPSSYRINSPGAISKENWSLRLPISLQDLFENKISALVSQLSESSGRI